MTARTAARSTVIVTAASSAGPSSAIDATGIGSGEPSSAISAPSIVPWIVVTVRPNRSTPSRVSWTRVAWSVRQSRSEASIVRLSARPRISFGGGSDVAVTVRDDARTPEPSSADRTTVSTTGSAANQAIAPISAAATTRTNRQPRTSDSGQPFPYPSAVRAVVAAVRSS